MKRTWEQSYQIMVDYYNEFGTTNVPKKYIYKDCNLNGWACEQRKKFNKGNLSQEKIDLLKKIGFSFDFYDDKWNTNYAALKDFVNTVGNADVPRRYEVNYKGEIIRLGRWVFAQRDAYHGLGNGKITKEHIDMLNELGFNWTLEGNSPKSTSFNESVILYYASKIYPNACKYRKGKVELDVFIPELNLAIEYDGRYWHSSDKDIEKNLYCKKNNIKLIRIRENGLPQLNDYSCDYFINPDNKKELENVLHIIFPQFKENDIDIIRDMNDIHSTYRTTLTSSWVHKFSLCKDYVEEHKKMLSCYYVTKDGIKLGSWLHDQRKSFKKGTLSQEKIDLMNSLGVQWVAA